MMIRRRDFCVFQNLLKIPILFGSQDGLREARDVYPNLWHLPLQKIQAPTALEHVIKSTQIAISFISDLKEEDDTTTLYISDMDGTLYPPAVIYLLMRFMGANVVQAEHDLFRLTIQRVRHVDHRDEPIHIFSTPEDFRLLVDLREVDPKTLVPKPSEIQKDLLPFSVAQGILPTTFSYTPHVMDFLPISHLPRRIRGSAVFGTIDQFWLRRPECSWACGPTSILAAWFAHFVPPVLWTDYTIINSLILQGAMVARIGFENTRSGHMDIPSQMKTLRMDLVGFRSKDASDSLNPEVGFRASLEKWYQRSSQNTSFILSSILPQFDVGHHTFISIGPVCYWLETMHCYASTLSTHQSKSSQFGSFLSGGFGKDKSKLPEQQSGAVLRIFDSLSDLACFAEHELRGKRWAMYLTTPSRFNHTDFLVRNLSIRNTVPTVVRPDYTPKLTIRQERDGNMWVAFVEDPIRRSLHSLCSNPFTINLVNSCLKANIHIPAGSIVTLRSGIPILQEEPQSHDKICWDHANKTYIPNDIFARPEFWCTEERLFAMVSYDGTNIIPWMRNTLPASNTQFLDSSDISFMVTKDIQPGGELLRPIPLHCQEEEGDDDDGDLWYSVPE